MTSPADDGRVWRGRVMGDDEESPIGKVEPVLSRFAHDRDTLHRDDADWLDTVWPDARVLVVTDDHRVPVTESDSGPAMQWRGSAGADRDGSVYLGRIGDVAHFLVRGARDLKGEDWLDLRGVGEFLSVSDAGLLVEAIALTQWHDRHTHCPLCGAPTEYVNAGWSTRCTNDGSMHFPRTDPAVIMLVHDGADRCVLGRQATWPDGRFSILAGFVEPGESLEAAVAREVDEEVGLTVTDIRYVGSQPWPFPASVMLGFVARVEGSQELDLRDHEIAEARWFSRDDLRDGVGYQQSPSAVSIAHHIIRAWIQERL